MTDKLIALYEGHAVGVLHYKADRLQFDYSDEWRSDPLAFPLSLSMPLAARSHSDAAVRPFIEGLLPDNASILTAWGKRFHVSARNPYKLLSHVGHECAGAVQFIQPNERDTLINSKKKITVDWLDENELIERLQSLINDHSMSRQEGDQGHFSLAGAQPKTALFYDEEKQRWGVPYGNTPTTHILKPNIGDYLSYDLNEHYCLRLAERIGLTVAESSVKVIGDIPTIIVKRYDRINTGQGIRRVHQEDMCQALAYRPLYKYQNEEGPTPKEIFTIIKNNSSAPAADTERFLNALLLNWIIGGTDAHAKNYSILIAGNGQVRLAPLYDISSCLPYPKAIPIRKAKLAMKVASDCKLYKISLDHWKRSARNWGLSEKSIHTSASELCQLLILHAVPLAEQLSLSLKLAEKDNILPSLASAITGRARDLLISS